MKKICFLILLGCNGFILKAQDLDKIKDLANQSKFAEAKAGIDKYVLKNANDPEALYYKGVIYNALSSDKTTPDAEAYNLKNESFESFKKTQALDPKDIWLTLEAFQSYLNLYAGFYDLAAKQFNAKNFEAAYQAFKKANEVKDYTLSKKYTYSQITLHPLDTVLVLNTAVAATQAKKIEEGISFYRKLTDANVSGKDYENVYEYLVDYYAKKDDKASMQALLEKAKKLYPSNSFWVSVEIKTLADKGDTLAMYAKYDELIEKDPGNFDLAYGYAVDLYNNVIKKDPKSPETIALTEKLTAVLKKAIASDKGIDATVLMANHLFNVAADLLNAANLTKGTKPEDVKKKADLKARATTKMDETIGYAETAVKYFEAQGALKPMQRANYKIMLDHLSEMYNAKNNKAKVAEYEAKNKAADKL